jgi:tRNA-2-methylthio-N6-dimethylallyladenosine synthase
MPKKIEIKNKSRAKTLVKSRAKSQPKLQSFRLPQTYHIITIGCQMNKSDSEHLDAFLASQGMRSVATFNRAGLVIINTCGVRQMAEDRAYGLVKTIREANPKTKIVIAGCLSRRADVQKRLAGQVDLFLPINEMMNLPALLDGRSSQAHFSLDEIRLQQGEKYLQINPKHASSFTACVPIGNGCNNFCSYCVVPYARGREVYRPATAVISEVKELIKDGYKEILLLAQNVNSYHDKNYDFPKLLAQLIKIPGHFWLRFSSSHPKDMSPALIKVFASSDKVCSHLHLAVQSGDNKILQAMNRKYTVEHYQKLIKKVRAVKPGVAITTDVIVGFPGETKAQFNNTAKLFRAVNFDLAYLAQYSPRPGTVSATMADNVSRIEKKRRWDKLNNLLSQSALKNNRAYLGREVEVLVDGKNKRGKYYGKTGTYKNVLFTGFGRRNLLGHFVIVKITEAMPFGLEGEFVADKK